MESTARLTKVLKGYMSDDDERHHNISASEGSGLHRQRINRACTEDELNERQCFET